MSILVEGMKKPNICYEIIDGEVKRCPFLDAYDDCVILRKKGIWTGTTWEKRNIFIGLNGMLSHG